MNDLLLEPYWNPCWLEIDDGPHQMSSAKLTLHHPQIVDVYYIYLAIFQHIPTINVIATFQLYLAVSTSLPLVGNGIPAKIPEFTFKQMKLGSGPQPTTLLYQIAPHQIL